MVLQAFAEKGTEVDEYLANESQVDIERKLDGLLEPENDLAESKQERDVGVEE